MRYTISFRPDANLVSDGRKMQLQTRFGAYNLTRLEAELPGMIGRIHDGTFDEQSLGALAMSEKGMKGLSAFTRWWRFLEKNCCVSYTLQRGDSPIARINPVGFGFAFNQKPLESDTPQVLSRFTIFRRKDNAMLLECPKDHAEIVCMDPRLSTLIFALCRPCPPEALAEKSGLDEAEVCAFLSMLLCAKAICQIGPDGSPAEEHEPALAQWEVHDLYFHSRSRMGRHTNGWATTYRFKDRFGPIPQIKNPMSDAVTKLAKPDMDAVCRSPDAPSFFQIIENRASRREYDKQPLGVDELGVFLYHCFRVKEKYDDELGGVTFRPAPGGGALHSLELYVLVNSCNGLDRGFYHYNPLLHQLEKISDPTPHTDRMLFLGRQMMLDKDDPQVEIVFASRFQRIQWKYESIAYSVILKDVGCLYQTMYLVAEAMDLAGVALGGGDSDLFAAVSGLDYFTEGSVGAFMLGSRKTEETR